MAYNRRNYNSLITRMEHIWQEMVLEMILWRKNFNKFRSSAACFNRISCCFRFSCFALSGHLLHLRTRHLAFFFAAHWLIIKTDADQTQQPARMNVNDFIRVERLYLMG